MMKYFSDVGGATVELLSNSIYGMNNAEFVQRWPDIKGKRYDSFRMCVGLPPDGKYKQDELPLTRRINYKSHPSKHECDARCMHAKGRTMNCECRCGGANHGIGG
jgi:hypothetical protein